MALVKSASPTLTPPLVMMASTWLAAWVKAALEVGLGNRQQRGGSVGVGVVRARQAVEQRNVAEPGAGFDIGECDLFA